jgi:hypothetical protein
MTDHVFPADAVLEGGRPNFTALPNWLAGKTTCYEMHVLWALQYHWPNIRPSLNRLAAITNLSRRKVALVLQDMERKGWISRQQRCSDDHRKLTTVYTLTVWEGDPAAGGSAPHALGVVHDMHQGSAHGALGVVHTVHQGSAPHAPKEEQEKKNKKRRTTEVTALRAREPEPEPAPKATRKQPFKPTAADVPPELQPVAVELLDFWAEKRGARTTRAWSGLLSELTRIAQDMHGGVETVRTQLNAAVQSGWQSVTYANWQRYAKPAAKPFGNSTATRYASRAERQTEAVEDVVAFLDAYEPAHAAPPLTLF